MATRLHRGIHNIEHTKKVAPFITRDITYGQNVSELVSGVTKFDLDLGFQIDSVEQPASATLWVLDMCLIVGLRL